MASRVHRVRYYNPKPETINCVALNKNNKTIAFARVDSSIEFWDLSHAPYRIKVIPGVEGGSIEALCWVQNRLLSTGLGGALVEWDLEKLVMKNSVLLTGYAAWCLDVNPANTLVAVGTEQGYINLFDVSNDDIIYSKLFDKQEGRIICCKFDKTGNILVTGSLNSIRVWNVATGHAMNRMSVTRRNQETMVWCLAVLSDGTVVSGDSHGRLIFWDSVLGDQIESFTTHRADILTIAVDDEEKTIYCSGMDPAILSYIKIDKGADQGGIQWVKHVQRQIHEHDIRALVMCGNKLVSLGADGYLTLSSYPPKWIKRVPPMIPNPSTSTCAQKKLLLLRYKNHLEVWKLGSNAVNNGGNMLYSDISDKNLLNGGLNNELELETTAANDDAMEYYMSRKLLKIAENPIKLVSVQTKKNKQLRCCELAPSGEFIVYSTDTDVRMLKLETDDDEASTSLSKMIVNGVSSPCHRITFTEDSRAMVAHSPGSLQVLQIDPGAGATVVQTIKTDKYLNSGTVLHLMVSKRTPSKRMYLVAADTDGTISVWAQTTSKFEHYATLPKYEFLPSALTVDCQRESLVVAYVDQKLVEYELVPKKLAEWPRTSLPPRWYSRGSAVLSITVHPSRDALIFQDETSLWILEKKPHLVDEPDVKKSVQTERNFTVKAIPIKYLAGFHWIGEDEAVCVEVLPENIVSQLPPALATKHNFVVG